MPLSIYLHSTAARQRLGHDHKSALALVRHYDAIVHEDPQIANMTRRPEPGPDDSGGYAARNRLRAGLARQGTRDVT